MELEKEVSTKTQYLDIAIIRKIEGTPLKDRKVISPSKNALIPVAHFKLYAICTRYPEKLLKNMDKKKLFTDVTYSVSKSQNQLQGLFLSKDKSKAQKIFGCALSFLKNNPCS